MKLLVGLGNPGIKYEKTRHNMGFMVVEQFLKDCEPVKKTVWEDHTKFKSDIALLDISSKKNTQSQKILLVKPKTYMNNSGLAVSLLAQYYKILPNDIWIIYDEADLPLGAMKIRFGGATAGHHGVESIIEQLGTDKFWRFRMGIGLQHQRLENDGKRQRKIDDYVLGGFTGPEKGKVKDLIKHGAKALALAIEEGLDSAQNRFNTK